jgi:hypothetical protein
MTTETAPRMRIFRIVDTDQLVLAVHDLERRLDRLDDATWPGANVERARLLDEADAAREELDRRVSV